MPEQPDVELSAAASPRKKGVGFKFILVVVLILALGGISVYLLSLMNSKKYFLEQTDGKLYIKQGILFVTGSESYKPVEPKDAWLYEPIEAPEEYKSVAVKEFDDMVSLHQELGRILIKQAQELVFSDDDARYNKGKAHIKRLRALPDLTGKQHDLVKALQADLDYIEGKQAYLGMEQILEAARRKFVEAKTYGTGHFSDTDEWIEKIDSLLVSIRATKAGKLPKLPPLIEILPPSGEAEPEAPVEEAQPPAIDNLNEDEPVMPNLKPNRSKAI